MKILVVYYSRTQTTKKIGQKISELLNCDIEGINEPTNRKGVLGFLKSGKEASFKIIPKINHD